MRREPAAALRDFDLAYDRFGSIASEAIVAGSRRMSGVPQKLTCPSLPTPALGECRHRGFARCLVSVSRHAILMMSEGERPHPRRSYRGRSRLHDTADDNTISEHVEVSFIPFAGWARMQRCRHGCRTADIVQGCVGHVVLRGANPAELPIERPTKFETVLNMRTAHALGISIPTSLLLRADDAHPLRMKQAKLVQAARRKAAGLLLWARRRLTPKPRGDLVRSGSP
jgi:hypothetical protein